MKYLTLVVLILILIGCKSDNNKLTINSNYDIKIIYSDFNKDKIIPNQRFNDLYLRDGKLYVTFECSFEKDTIELSIDGKVKHKDIITTDWSDGVATQYIFDDITEIDNVGIRVNNGKKALIEVDTMNFILVQLRDSILEIRIPKNVHYYD